jgi:tRNA 2-selenouridine synthase
MSQFEPKLKLSTVNDFKKIVLQNTPLIDVRAPVEFEKGAFEQAINLPLMQDEERRLVGIKYKEEGNDAAVELGHKLVNDTVRQPRIEAWKQLVAEHQEAVI